MPHRRIRRFQPLWSNTMLRYLNALAVAAAVAGSASAGWDNVFTLTCDTPRVRASFYEAPANDCDTAPKVSYLQRTYYQPETSYVRECYSVPVQERVKSYYYEPVTSYRYTSYYDPCSGCCQKVAVPTTSYAIREQCNYVTRWMESSRLVPVTSYKAVTKYTPVVTYYYPQVDCPSSFKIPLAPPAGRIEAAPAPMNPAAPNALPESEALPKQTLPTTPMNKGTSVPAPSNRGAYTASRTKATLRGEVTANDRTTPRPNTKVIFLNARNMTTREETYTNSFGEFDIQLPEGEWVMYLGKGTGSAEKHSTLTVAAGSTREVRVASR
jgi:hypothetical protein